MLSTMYCRSTERPLQPPPLRKARAKEKDFPEKGGRAPRIEKAMEKGTSFPLAAQGPEDLGTQ